MVESRLHVLGLDVPFGFVEANFNPPAAEQLPRAQHGIGAIWSVSATGYVCRASDSSILHNNAPISSDSVMVASLPFVERGKSFFLYCCK